MGLGCRLGSVKATPVPSCLLHPGTALRAARPSRAPPLCARAMSSAAASSGRTAFAGSSVEDLKGWLARGGIPLDAYGKGPAKTVEQLWVEVQEGETRLFMEGSRPTREVAVMNVLISNDQGKVLYEAEQVLPNGSRRVRGLPLSEKMVAGERWQEAAVRAVLEELGPVLPDQPQVEVDEGSMVEEVEAKESQSYPGLLSKYTCKRVGVRVPSGLPAGSFTTVERRSDGTLTHCWEWR